MGRMKGAGIGLALSLFVATGAFSSIGSKVVYGPSGSFFGASLAFADVNADGLLDIALGAPYSGGGTGGGAAPGKGIGEAWVYSNAGNPLRRYYAPEGANGFGRALESAGDVDVDGRDDLLIGAPDGQTGKAFVYSGAYGKEEFPLFTMTAGREGDGFGSSVARVGNRLVIGAPGRTGGDGQLPVNGRVHVYSLDGGPLLTLEGEPEFGFSLAETRDLDGDGIPDLAVGSPKAAGGLGQVSVYSTGTGDLLRRWNGEERHARFGHSLAAQATLGHPNQGEYIPCILAGAPFSNVAGYRTGALYALRLDTGGIYWRSFLEHQPYACFGTSIDDTSFKKRTSTGTPGSPRRRPEPPAPRTEADAGGS